jgi:hypothetical protein
MSLRARFLLLVFCVLTLATHSFAQNADRRQPVATPPGDDATVARPADLNSVEAVVNEIGLLRKSVQSLNTRLREIGDKLPALNVKPGGVNDQQRSVALSLDLLTRAEERAGILRKQLIELIEKETTYRTRLTQMDEDARPENIERALSGVGTTRTAELRDVRRRSLDIERRGLESLLGVSTQTRSRLEEDVRQADSLVSRIRQRILPLIDKELEKISPN